MQLISLIFNKNDEVTCSTYDVENLQCIYFKRKKQDYKANYW